MALLTKQKWYVKASAYAAIAVWAAGTGYPAGTLIRQNTTPTVGNERIFLQLATAGTPTSGGSEPAWSVTQGAKTTDNSCTWIEITGKPAVNGDATNTFNWTQMKAQTANPSQGVLIKNGAGTHYFILSTTAGGAVGGSEPTWNTGTGATTTDNAVTWTCIGAVGNFSAWGAPHSKMVNALTFRTTGDVVWLSKNHSFTSVTGTDNAINFAGNATDPTPVLSVDDSTAPPTSLSTGATENSLNSTTSFQGVGYIYGLSLFVTGTTSTKNIQSTGSNQFDSMIFESCNLGLSTTGAGGSIGASGSNFDIYYKFINCNFTFGNAAQSLSLQLINCEFVGCVFAGTGTVPTSLFVAGFNQGGGTAVFRSCDLSAITGNIINYNNGTPGTPTNFIFYFCKLGAGVTFITGNTPSEYNQVRLRFYMCDSSATNYRYVYKQANGLVVQETTIVRSGTQATDGVTAISWNVSTTAQNNFYLPLELEPITIWNNTTGSPKTLTIYLVSGTALDNSLVWAELEYLGSSGSPIGSTSTTKNGAMSTAAALTADSSTWGGSPPANKYKIAFTFTPQMAGPVRVRLFIGATSLGTTYVDPYPYIT